MKYTAILSLLFFVASCKKEAAAPDVSLKSGDIIFQTSTSGQSKAIQLATHSKYSHCGIIFQNDGKDFVFEAVQPVKLTPLNEWIKKGEDSHYVVKRLKDTSVLTPKVLDDMRTVGRGMLGKDYDLYFEWSNMRLYCSELVWKIYKDGAHLEVGYLQKLGDFDLSSPAVKQKLKERYGENIPKDEMVISPQAIFESDLLTTVTEE
ncbi:peptidoglycan peptidase [Flavobacterium akiainvivens]|uniref:Peptidoglycan peptidase n=1 Tax=Flavobacterium akiainvivens TaxID=1202724 RepID=A0A0M9VK80_9FLAO|nr:YiiX family permuted papain-like enzyme [Flavobacterium akiainvivens]KOS08259.1 peptidoglycan peptidase [Flavobacterium akiainvivens]SFQ53735.1 Permuted papain-like amidase enzyme, YaeF/YiiX, C92 family [Flavobacterium akiainvivens]